MTGATPDARSEVLARIRSALGPAPRLEDVPRDYRADDDRGPAELIDLLDERLTDYRATVFRTDVGNLAATVGEAIRAGAPGDGGRRLRIAIPTDLPAGWMPTAEDLTTVVDEDLSADELDAHDGVVTGAAVAVAETGTIVLDGQAASGRRALTLVPDLHVCVVTADQIVATVPEAVARLTPTRPQTWISGPSATSDIELDRVEGVHGPRTLHVVLVAG